MYSGFQSSMAQNNAFQIIGSVNPDSNTVILLGGTPAGPNVNPNAPGFFYDTPYEAYKREQAALAEKQEAIIALKLEAQENHLRRKELEKERDKQSKRQLKALEREQHRLEASIQEAMIELASRRLIARNNEAILVLMMAYPFLNIGGTMH
jgi:hypothetical protein